MDAPSVAGRTYKDPGKSIVLTLCYPLWSLKRIYLDYTNPDSVYLQQCLERR